MISKKLLSEVFENKCISIIEINGILKYNNEEYQDSVYGYQIVEREINIYELAYKCKEWAYNNGIAIDSCFQTAIIHLDKPIEIKANTELEAVFKACEYILKQKEEK